MAAESNDFKESQFLGLEKSRSTRDVSTLPLAVRMKGDILTSLQRIAAEAKLTVISGDTTKPSAITTKRSV
jgi:hypothetical protein